MSRFRAPCGGVLRAFVAVAVSTGCSIEGPAPDQVTSSDSSAPADATTEARKLSPSRIPSDFQCDPTLDSIQAGIFQASCGLSHCHGRDIAAWGLYLLSDIQTVHDRLVNAPAASCAGWTLVTPGDPERSFLWNKVTQAPPACGERMPFGFEPLPDVALECVRGWIEQL